MPEALRWELLDLLLDLPARDWDAELIAHYGKDDGRCRAGRERDRIRGPVV